MTMAESAAVETSSAATHDKANNNHPLVINHNHRMVAKSKKRKRLSQVLDKLTGGGTPPQDNEPSPDNPPINNNVQQFYNNNEGDNIKIEELKAPPQYRPEVFKFDIPDRERYKTISEDEDVFSPASSSNKSPHSSTESPRIRFSPLRIKDDPSPSPPSIQRPPLCPCYQCVTGAGHHPPPLHPYDRFFPASPISPLTPASPAPSYSFEHYFHSKYLPDIFQKRSRSDSDLPLWFEAAKAERARAPPVWPHPLTLSTTGCGKGSLESDTLSPQESPLDLSMKTSRSRERLECLVPSPLHLLTPGFMPPRGPVSVPVVKGDVASPTTKRSVASRYNLEVSPVVEEMPPGSDVAYVCPVCGQMFSLHDRLAKHMASRHKSRQSGTDATAKAFL
ncbi:hypothetical protein JTB14_031365 [Gonioctena quinquepunctata]|nr:hypothetical protein JTB14_031365 [Gonioctena quinquepunctata]